MIANFADHDHIGVGAEKRAHRGGKIEADFGIHLDLPQAGLRDLHGIFRSPDFSVAGIDRRRARNEAWWFFPSRSARRKGSSRKAYRAECASRADCAASFSVDPAESAPRRRGSAEPYPRCPILKSEWWRRAIRSCGRAIWNLILPSCGLRRSAMSKPAIIFKRDTSARRYAAGTCKYSKQRPSTRKRIRVSRSAPLRLDMNVRNPLVAGIDDQLVDQAHDGAVIFVDELLDARFRRVFVLALELAQEIVETDSRVVGACG